MTNLSNPTFFSPIEGAFFTLDISIKKGSFGEPKKFQEKNKKPTALLYQRGWKKKNG